LLARRPEQRYPSASDLIVDLERSELTAAVPSFVDLDLALRDPVVRQQLSAAAQPTSVDVSSAPPAGEKVPEQAGFWFLRFKDKHGQTSVRKLTQAQVLQRLREGKLSTRVAASRSAQGEFRPLGTFPEFRDIQPAPRATSEASQPVKPVAAEGGKEWRDRLARIPWLWVLAVILGIGIIALIAVAASRL